MAQLNLTKNTAALDLTKVAPSLKTVKGVLAWDMHPVHKNSTTQGFDLDIFAFCTTKGKIIAVPDDVVFFNNKSAYNGGVVYPHDSRDGSDAEEIQITLDKVPGDKDKIELFVFIHEGVQRQQDFSMVNGGSFTLYDDQQKVIQDYKLQQFVNGTALHIGSLQRNASGWSFDPMGESAVADANQVLTAFA